MQAFDCSNAMLPCTVAYGVFFGIVVRPIWCGHCRRAGGTQMHKLQGTTCGHCSKRSGLSKIFKVDLSTIVRCWHADIRTHCLKHYVCNGHNQTHAKNSFTVTMGVRRKYKGSPQASRTPEKTLGQTLRHVSHVLAAGSLVLLLVNTMRTL